MTAEREAMTQLMYGELEGRLRREVDLGGWDGHGIDPLHISAADAIANLRTALTSQIEITNAERARAERLERLSRSAEPRAYVVTPKNPAFGPSLVFKPGEFASEYALIEPLYGRPPEPADAKDAARYRWLRVHVFDDQDWGQGECNTPEQVDTMIDAAMAQELGE